MAGKKAKKEIFIVFLVLILTFALAVIIYNLRLSREAAVNLEKKAEDAGFQMTAGQSAEAFEQAVGQTILSGTFAEYDDKENLLYILSFDSATKRSLVKPFKISPETVFSKISSQFKSSDLLSFDVLKKTEPGISVLVFYNSGDSAANPAAMMVQMDDSAGNHFFLPAPSR